MEWTPFSAVAGRADGAEGKDLSFPEYMLSEWLDLQDIPTGSSRRCIVAWPKSEIGDVLARNYG